MTRDWATVPRLAPEAFRDRVADRVRAGARLAALFGAGREGDAVPLVAVLADPGTARLDVVAALARGTFPALTPACSAAHLFEREIAELWGVAPAGHPWLKPVRTLPGSPAGPAFYEMGGEEIHEVAVGPVHAGVIEPGHFRFQCHGERVFHLEIALGYQHRGVERAAVGGPGRRTVHHMETLAGDSTAAHATAHARVVEALAGAEAPPRAQAIRALAIELERMANHAGDLGALAGDVGYLPTASFCGRLRGEFLNLTALLCGSRFGRGLVRPGGVRFDLEPARAAELLARLEAAWRDLEEAVGLLWASPSVMARFEGAGTLDAATARTLGVVGPAARASGLAVDARAEFPWGPYAVGPQSPVVERDGDVLARARVRWRELERSATLVRALAGGLPDGPLSVPVGALPPMAIAASLVEGWRGEVCHAAVTREDGRFAAYKVVDPSFHNWPGLAHALRDQPISDFPLCNKSFNLSYCGFDL